VAVVAYLRCSPRGSGGSVEERSGLRGQSRAISSWAASSGEVLRSVHREIVSSVVELSERPALLAAFAEVEPGDVLAVAARDRVARSVPLMVAFERAVERLGARFVAVRSIEGDSPEARYFARMDDARAEYERELIRARTRLTAAARKAAGLAVGHAPLGWRIAEGGRLEPDEAEQQARRWVRSWVYRGRGSLRRCCR
jgi:DNA invertase Pin-like site-specific DNA recombinase